MSDIIADGVVRVGVEDNTRSELARIEAEYKSTMAKLGREEATIRIKGNIEDFKHKVDEAKARYNELEKLEKQEADRNSQLSAQQKAASDQRLKELRSEKAALGDVISKDQQQLDALNKHYSTLQQYNREAALGEKQRAAAAKAEQDSARVRAQSDAAAIRAQQDLTKARNNDAAAAARVAALQKQFADQSRNAASLGSQLSNLAPGTARFQEVSINRDKVLADMRNTREQLAALGREPIKQHLELDTSAARQAWNLWTQGTRSGRDSFISFSDLVKKFFGARLNIGPITASIGGFIGALGSLAPIILGLIGAFGSLVSVMGAGLVGAIGVGGAAMTGFGLATLGVGLAFHPLIQQMGIAHTAITNYDKQVQLYGKNSTQAKKAQEEMNNALAHLPKPVQEAAKGFSQLNNEFQKLTKPTALQAFATVTQSAMKTAGADMGFFARDTNVAMTQASQGFAKWINALRSGGARQILDNIFTNFNKSIPSILAGLGSLGAAFGRWFSTMSNYLPGLAKDFATWAQHINDTSKATNGWAASAPKLIQSFKDIISFVGAAGRVLVTFFKAGIGPGNSWIEQMTNSLNKLANSMNSVAGQQKLTNFFGQSISVTKEVFNALQPLLSLFVHLAALFTPLVNAMLPMLATFTQFVSAVVSALGPFGKIIVDVGAFIALGRVLGRLSLFSGIIGEAKNFINLISAAAAGLKAFAAAGAGISGIKAGLSAFKDVRSAAAADAGATAGASTMGATIEAASATGGATMGAEIEGASTAGGATMAAEITAATAGGVAVTDAGAVAGAGAAAGSEVGGSISAAGGAAGGEIAAALEGAGVSVGAEIAAAMTAGAAEVAAAIEAAFVTGGAAAAAESGAGAAAGGAAAGAAGGAIAGEGAAAGATAGELGGVAAGEGAVAAGAGAAEGSVVGLGAAFLAVAAPIAAAVAVVGSFALGIYRIINPVNASKETLDGITKSSRQVSAGFNALSGTSLDVFHAQQQQASAGQQLVSTHKQITSTQGTLNKLSDQGKQNTQAYKDAIQRLNGELEQQHTLEVQQDQQKQKFIATSKAETKIGQDNLKRAQSEIDLAKADIRLNGENANNRAALTKALKDQYDAQNQVVLGQFNMQRAQAGLFPLVGKNADETAKYASQLRSLMDLTKNSPKAQSFLIHVPDPRDLLKIQSTIAGLNNQKDINIAVNILAHAKNAEDAINKIDRLQVKEKIVKVNTEMGDTIAKLAQAQGIKLTPKELKILHSGDPAAIAALIKVKGINIDPKVMRIFGDIQDALRKHQNVRALADVNKILRMLGLDGSAHKTYGFWQSVGAIPKDVNFFGPDKDAHNTYKFWQKINNIPKNVDFFGPDKDAHNTYGYWQGIANISKNVDFFGQDKDAHDKYGAWQVTPNITKSIDFHVNVLGNSAQLAAINFPGFAKGGIPMGGVLGIGIPAFADGKPADRRSDGTSVRQAGLNDVADFMQRIVKSVAAPSTGGQYSKPTFLVGEEYRPEFVIATNPSYRERNKDLLKQAAAALGMQVFAKGGRHTTPYMLPPQDRIAGVGTQDIDTLIQTKVQDRQDYSNWLQRNHKHGAHYNRIMTQKTHDIRELRGFVAKAKYDQQDFQNLEDAITAMGHYEEAADRNPSGTAVGYDYDASLTHPKSKTLSWQQWHDKRQKLLAQHTARLQKAADDAKRRIGKLRGANNLHYIRALELALGQSIADEQAAAVTRDPGMSVDEFTTWADLNWEKGKKTLPELQYLYEAAQSDNVPDDPATAKREDILALSNDWTAAGDIVTRYKDYIDKAKKDPSIAGNFPLMRDLTSAYNQALTTFQGITKTITEAATVTGPTQAQLFDTAKGNMYKTFGSNFAEFGGAPGGSSLPATGTRAPEATSTTTNHYDVTNHFSAPPPDPHTWSKGLVWELGAAL